MIPLTESKQAEAPILKLGVLHQTPIPHENIALFLESRSYTRTSILHTADSQDSQTRSRIKNAGVEAQQRCQSLQLSCRLAGHHPLFLFKIVGGEIRRENLRVWKGRDCDVRKGRVHRLDKQGKRNRPNGKSRPPLLRICIDSSHP